MTDGIHPTARFMQTFVHMHTLYLNSVR